MDFKAFREKELKMDRTQFATYLGASEDEIILWEKTNEPPMEVLQCLSKKTGIPFLKLIKYKLNNEDVPREKPKDISEKNEIEKMNGRDLPEYLEHILNKNQYKNTDHSSCLFELKDRLAEISQIVFKEEDLPEANSKIRRFLETYVFDHIDRLSFACEIHNKVLNNRQEYVELMRRVALNEPDRISTAKVYIDKISKHVDELKEEFGKKLDDIFDEVLDANNIISYIDTNNYKYNKKDIESIYEGIRNQLIDLTIAEKDNDIEVINNEVSKYIYSMDDKIDEPYKELGMERNFDWSFGYECRKQDIIDCYKDMDQEDLDQENSEKKKGSLKDIGRAALIAVNLPNPFFWLSLGVISVKNNVTWKKDIVKYANEAYRGGWKADILSTVQMGFDNEQFIIQEALNLVKEDWEHHVKLYNELVNKSDDKIKNDIKEMQMITNTLREIAYELDLQDEEDNQV